MPSAYSTNLRLELIGSGEQPTTWGNTTNNNIGTLLEAAISGAVELTAWTGGDYTLSTLKGAADQARNMTLIVPAALAGAGNIVAPAVPKMYTVINKSAYDIGIKIGATTPVTIPSGDTRIVVSDGTQFRDSTSLPPATDTSLGGIIVGDGLEAEANGTLNVVPATDATIGGVIVGDGLDVGVGGVLDVVPATGTTIGGVIVNPDGLSVAGDGTLSLDAATSSAPGGVIVGTTLAVSSGTVNLPSITTAKSVTNANITVDVYGRVVAATDGTSSGGTVTGVSSTAPIIIDNTTPAVPKVTITEANSGTAGYLSSTNFNTFNNKYPSTGGTLTGTVIVDQNDGVLALGAVGTGNNWVASANSSDLTNTSYVGIGMNDVIGSGFKGVLFSGYTAGGGIGYRPLGFATGGVLRAEFDTSGNLYPTGDGAYDFGTSSLRWDTVYAAGGVVTTSDATLKTDIADSDLGLEFINDLRPVSYKWVTRQNIFIPTGGAEAGSTLSAFTTVPLPGVRNHYGFIAQEVKATLGIKDFAGYIEPEEGPLGLRYSEFIAPMVKAIQELSAKVDALTTEVNILKGV